jgi:hypothetical protein
VSIEAAVAALDDSCEASGRGVAREVSELVADALSLVFERRLRPEEEPAAFSP